VPDTFLDELSYEQRELTWKKGIKENNVYIVENENGQVIGFSTGGKERTGKYEAYIGELYAIYILKDRTLCQYDKSQIVFEKGIEQFPENKAMEIFYAMTLYNVGKYREAIEVLLTSLAQSTNDSETLSYKTAIEFYADKLDQTW